MGHSPEKHNDLKICYYAVGWVDFLGQSDALKQITSMPTSEEERKEFLEKAKPTFGHISRFRENTEKLIAQLSGSNRKENIINPEWLL